ncbi:MAG: M16 family metallopeptidase [Promethearchaeota archaeon]
MSVEQSEIVTMDNNLKIQLISIPGGKTTLFAVGFHAGSMYESGFGPGSNDGISHFLEHMFFKGTPNRTSKQINEAFTRLGADLNAYTTYDHTLYYAKIPTRNLHQAAEIWKDLLVNKVINREEFESEKQVILQEIQLYADMPEFDTNYEARKKHFKGTPLEHNILGTHDSVGSITYEMMIDYVSRYYSLDNAIVTLVGGFDLEVEKQYLISLFNDPILQPKINPIYPPQINYISHRNTLNDISFHKKDFSKPLSYVTLTWTAPGVQSTNFIPLLLLNTYIGNSRTSLLYREITSKGIASVCRYSFEALNDVSISSIFFITPPNEIENVFQKVIDLLAHLHDLEITSEITSVLKEETWGAYLSEIEDPTNYGIDLSQKFVKFRHPLFLREFQEEIMKITPEDIQDAKKNLLEDLKMTVYASGTIQDDWEPHFPDHSFM